MVLQLRLKLSLLFWKGGQEVVRGTWRFTFHLIYLQQFQISFPLKYQLPALFSGIHSSA